MDLSAAFDTIDHQVEHSLDITDSALALMKSYLDGRKQCVQIEGVILELAELACGMPQGSVLGPLKLCIYMLPIASIMRHYDIYFHIYADDTQLYVSFDLCNPNVTIDRMNLCISDLRIWRIRNKLKINDSKTEFLIITSSFIKQSFDDLNIMIGDSNIVSSNSARNLGVIVHKCMKLDYHISSVCKSTYFHLRNIGGIRNIISNDACAQLIHSLVTVRLDHCNSILYCLPDNSLYRLQKIQNTAERILARLPRFTHISATLFDLHWLPIRYRRLLFSPQLFSTYTPMISQSMMVQGATSIQMTCASHTQYPILSHK